MDVNTPHVQVKFFTKQSKYAVPDTPFSVPNSVATQELSSLINGLIKDSTAEEEIDFDFLIDGEFLRVSLDKHLEQKDISTETVVEVEYVERHPAPVPEDSLDHDDWVSCISSCQQCILSCCYDNTVRLWSSKGSPILTIPGHTQPVKCVSWIDHGNGPVSSFLSGSHDQTILMWQWNSKKNEVDCIHACRGHAGSVDCVAVDSSKQRFCSGSWDKMLKLWSAVIDPDEKDPEDTEEEKPQKRRKGHKVQTRVPILTLSGHTEGVSAVTWLQEQEVCTASWDHTIRLWDLEQAAQKSSLVYPLKEQPERNGRICYGGMITREVFQDNRLTSVLLTNRLFKQGSKVFLDISYSVLNRLIVSGSADRHVRLWDPRVADGAIVKCTYTSHSGWVSSVRWSTTNEQQFLSGSYDNTMKLWDKRSPKAPLYNLTGHMDKILAVDWSIPSLMMSGGADNQLKIFQYQDTSIS